MQANTTVMGKRRRKRSKSAPAKLPAKPNHPIKRKQWSEMSVVSAMEAVRSGTVSINKATLLHLVPHTTLKDRLSGRVVHGTKPGPKPYTWPRKKKQCFMIIRLKLPKQDMARHVRTQVKLMCSERKQNPKVKSHFRWLVAQIFGEATNIVSSTWGPYS